MCQYDCDCGDRPQMMYQLLLWGQATDDVSIVIVVTDHRLCINCHCGDRPQMMYQLLLWGQTTYDMSIVTVGTGHR